MDQAELLAEFAALSQLIAERMAEGDLAAVSRYLTELLALSGASTGARLQTGDSAEIGGYCRNSTRCWATITSPRYARTTSSRADLSRMGRRR